MKSKIKRALVQKMYKRCYYRYQKKPGKHEFNNENIELWTFKDVINQPELMIILTVDSFLSYQCQVEILIDTFAVLVCNWSMLQLSICTSVSIFFVTIMLLVVEKIFVGDVRSIYYLYVLAFLSNMMANSLLGIVSTITLGQEFWQFFNVSFLLILVYLPYFASHVYCRSIIFYITPEHSASIVDSYRQVIHLSSMCLGFFTTNYVFDVLDIIMLPCSVIAFGIVLSRADLEVRHSNTE